MLANIEKFKIYYYKLYITLKIVNIRQLIVHGEL